MNNVGYIIKSPIYSGYASYMAYMNINLLCFTNHIKIDVGIIKYFRNGYYLLILDKSDIGFFTKEQCGEKATIINEIRFNNNYVIDVGRYKSYVPKDDNIFVYPKEIFNTKRKY